MSEAYIENWESHINSAVICKTLFSIASITRIIFNAKNNVGSTALMIAAENGHTDIAQMLKKAGAKE